MQTIAALLVHRVENLVGGVKADEIEQRERAHGKATAKAHRGVNIFAACVLGFEHRRRVIEVAEEQGVGDEASLVANDDGLFIKCCGHCRSRINRLGCGDDRAHDLNELLHRGWVEEVHSNNLRRTVRRDRDVRYGQGRGIRSKNRRRRNDGIKGREDLALEIQVLRYRFNDEFAIG